MQRHASYEGEQVACFQAEVLQRSFLAFNHASLGIRVRPSVTNGVNRPLLAEGWLKFHGKWLDRTHTCPCLLSVCLRNVLQECFFSFNLLPSLASSFCILSLLILPATSSHCSVDPFIPQVSLGQKPWSLRSHLRSLTCILSHYFLRKPHYFLRSIQSPASEKPRFKRNATCIF